MMSDSQSSSRAWASLDTNRSSLWDFQCQLPQRWRSADSPRCADGAVANRIGVRRAREISVRGEAGGGRTRSSERSSRNVPPPSSGRKLVRRALRSLALTLRWGLFRRPPITQGNDGSRAGCFGDVSSVRGHETSAVYYCKRVIGRVVKSDVVLLR